MPANHKSYNIIYLSCLLICMGFVGSLVIDLYVPSMPSIAQTFKVSATAVKFTITFYLLAYGSCQLLSGTLLDLFGRKSVMIVSLLISIVASLLCGQAQSITMLYAGRLLQGVGFAALGVGVPTLARDILNDEQFAEVSSIFSLVFGLGPIVAPILGAYIQHVFGWRATFYVIVAYSIILLFIAAVLLPETQPKHVRPAFKLGPILMTYRQVLGHRIFLANALGKAFAYMGFIVFYTVSPFLLQDHLKLTTLQYGWVTLFMTGAVLITKIFNTILLRFLALEKIIFSSLVLLTFSGFLLLGFGLLRCYSVMSVMLPFALFGFASGFLFSNMTVAAFTPFKQVSTGSVSGLMNTFLLLLGFIGSWSVAHISLNTLLPLGKFMAITGAIALGQYIYLTRQKS